MTYVEKDADTFAATLNFATKLSEQLMPKAEQPQVQEQPLEQIPSEQKKETSEITKDTYKKELDTKMTEVDDKIENLRKEIKETIKEEMSKIKE